MREAEAIRRAVGFELAYVSQAIFLSAYGFTPPSREVVIEAMRREVGTGDVTSDVKAAMRRRPR